jgi:[acyl-carrier-protein] S-malonyltransferase
MTLALLCSGQGRQGPAMLDLVAEDDRAAAVIATTAALLGADPYALLRQGAGDVLNANRTGQVLCVARALAVAACLEPLPPFVVAGYSVGEVAAWGVAGIWAPGQTLSLAARRAELMDEAGGADGGLGFVRGMERTAVDDLVARFGCAISIVNPERLFIIGGARTDVAACCAQALREGAASARPIAVNVASHTPWLAKAVAPFEAVLRAAGGGSPRRDRTLLGAAEARVVASAALGAPGLARQLAHTIDWSATLQAVVERGADRVLELGPGDALAQMVRSAYPHLKVRAVDDFRSLAGLRSWIAG